MEKYCKSCGRVFKDSNFKLCPYCGNQLSTREGRQPIPLELRHKVFKRDGYRCVECGASKDETSLEIDHIIPVSKGGTNDIDNLQTLCKECNRAKRARTWVGGKTDYETTKKELNSLKKKLEETEIKLKKAITEEDKIELKFKITKLKETIEVVQKRYDELKIEHEKWLQEQKKLKERELLYKRLYVELDEDTINIIIKYILPELSNKSNITKKEIVNELINRFDSYDNISSKILEKKEELKERKLLYKRLYEELDDDAVFIIKKYLFTDLSDVNNLTKEEIINNLITEFETYDNISKEIEKIKPKLLLYKRLCGELDDNSIDIVKNYLLVYYKDNITKEEIVTSLINEFESYDKISFYSSKASELSKCSKRGEYRLILDFAYYIYKRYGKDMLNINCEAEEISFPLDGDLKIVTFKEIFKYVGAKVDPPPVCTSILDFIVLKDKWNDKLKEFSKDISSLTCDEFMKFFTKSYDIMRDESHPKNNYPYGDGFVTKDTLVRRYGDDEVIIGFSILDYDDYDEFYLEIRPNELYYKCFSDFNWEKMRKEKRERDEEIRKWEEEEERRKKKEKETREKKRLRKEEERKRKEELDKRLKEIHRTRKCPNCGKEILNCALRCKYCKYSFKKYSNSNNKEKSFIERIFGL